MAAGVEVDLGPGHIVLDGDPALLPKKGADPPIFCPCLLWPNGWMDQDATCMEVGLGPNDIVLHGDAAPRQKRAQPSNFQPMSIVAKLLYVCIRIPPFGMEVSLSLGNIVLDGDPALLPLKGHSLFPNFWPMSIVAKWLDGLRYHLVWR